MSRLFSFVLFLFSLTLSAQTLQVRLTPEVIYAGDTFQVEASANDTELTTVSCSFSMPTRVIGQTSRFSSINGHVSYTSNLQILPEGMGVCRLESLTAVTKDGKSLTFTEPLEVQVRKLIPDEAVSIEMTASPQDPLPGDDVTLTLQVTAPAIKENGRLVSPFLEAGFFGRVQERLPRIQFNAELGEDSPLRLLSSPQLLERTHKGDALVWTITCTYRAVRVGEQVFPAPLIRDTRYYLAEKNNGLEETRCLAIGNPLTIEVKAPPMEGRPAEFTGAVAQRFQVSTALDALNVKVGDPIELTIQFKTDADPTQIRVPELPQLNGFRMYGEPIRNTLEEGCEFVYNLRPVQSGLLEIPVLSFAWFEKNARTYQTIHTTAIPIYAHPSAQLVLLGDDGEQLMGALPPALRLTYADSSQILPRMRFLLVLIAGVLLLLLRFIWAPCRQIGYWIVQKVTQKRPVRRLCFALKRAQTPEEALIAIRRWCARPTLTSTELANMLEKSQPADKVVAAVAQLERAVYSGYGDVSEACETLRMYLPLVTFRRGTSTATFHISLLLLLFLFPFVVNARADNFLREQAEALTLSAITAEDYARATALWGRLADTSNDSGSVLMNAAGCAIFARQPAIAERMIARYELLYGRDADSEQIVLAILDQTEKPYPWARTLFTPHYNYSVGCRFELLCLVAGLMCVLFALPWRRLLLLRVVVSVLGVALLVSVLISVNQLSHPVSNQSVAESTETEAGS